MTFVLTVLSSISSESAGMKHRVWEGESIVWVWAREKDEDRMRMLRVMRMMMLMMLMDDSVRKMSRSNQHVEVCRLSPEPTVMFGCAIKIERGLLTKPFTVMT